MKLRLALLLTIAISAPACTLTVGPDGSRSYAPHPETIQGIVVRAAK